PASQRLQSAPSVPDYRGWNSKRRTRIGVDQRRQPLRSYALEKHRIERVEDLAHVLAHGHVLMILPGARQPTPRRVVRLLQIVTGYSDSHVPQSSLEAGQSPRRVALVAGRAVEEESSPAIEGDCLDDHREAALPLAVLTVVALVGAVVAVVQVVAIAAKIDAVQEHSENPALDRFDLLGGPANRVVRDRADPDYQDDSVALGRERDAVRDGD